MKKNHYCNALKVLNIVKYSLSIILFILVISFAIVGHCASEEDYFPIEQNKNGHFTENAISTISSYFNDEDNYIVVYYFDYNYRVIVFPKSTYTNNLGQLCGEKNNALTHFSFYGLGVVPANTYQFQLINGTQLVNLQNFGGGFNYWQNLPSSNYDTSKDYISNLRIWTTNNTTKKLVIDYDEEPVYIDPTQDTYPQNAEKPEIDDYIPDWTDTPTFDSSSVENALQSVYNGIVWLGNNIKSTITGSIQYVADTIRWAIQKIIDTLRSLIGAVQNTINDIKNGILTIVDKIQGFFDYVSQPYDSTKVNTAFNNMTLKADYNNLTTLVNNSFSVFDSTAEPNTFQIPIHLERIPILHVQTVQYIDLGWLYDCREVIRIFMWCITTFGLLYTIIDSLPSYLSGNDE